MTILPFQGAEAARACLELWQNPRWQIRRVDTFEIIDRSSVSQRATFDIDSPSLKFLEIPSKRLAAQSGIILPVTDMERQVLLNVDTFLHNGDRLHLCRRSVNLAYSAHLWLGMLITTAKTPIPRPMLEVLYDQTILALKSDDCTQQLLRDLGAMSAEFDGTLRHDYVAWAISRNIVYTQCIELPRHSLQQEKNIVKLNASMNLERYKHFSGQEAEDSERIELERPLLDDSATGDITSKIPKVDLQDIQKKV